MQLSEPTVHTLGSRVHLVSVDRTVDHMESWIEQRDGNCRRVLVTGFHGLWEAHKQPKLQQILNSAELWVPDGIAPVWVAAVVTSLKRVHANIIGVVLNQVSYNTWEDGDRHFRYSNYYGKNTE